MSKSPECLRGFRPAPLPKAENIDVDALRRDLSDGTYDLVCVMGPTASGKTRYAVGLARELDAEIISADSRQVYRGMDIGTGKDLNEYGEVPVHLVDVADAGEKYNIYQYQKDFHKAYEEIVSRGRNVILCGGSGLYVEAAVGGYALADVPANPELRRTLEGKSLEELTAILSSMKSLHNSTDIDSCKRAIRAIEIASYHAEHHLEHTTLKPLNCFYIATLVSREVRNARIDARLDARLKEGLVEEVKGLLERGIPAEDLIYYGLEYKFVTQYVLGELSFEQMRELLSIAIHQFAKRQMTWLRGMQRDGKVIHWTEP